MNIFFSNIFENFPDGKLHTDEQPRIYIHTNLCFLKRSQNFENGISVETCTGVQKVKKAEKAAPVKKRLLP